MHSTYPPCAATIPYSVTAVNRHDSSDGRRVRLRARDAAHALQLAQLEIGAHARHVVIRRLPDPASHCHRCGRYVSPRETGLADLRTWRLWCNPCGQLVTRCAERELPAPLLDLQELAKAFVDGAFEGLMAGGVLGE